MNKSFLMELLYANVPNGKYDLLLDIIIPNLSKLRVFFLMILIIIGEISKKICKRVL